MPNAANERSREILSQWQAYLQSDRGARARLRRCTTPAEALLEPAFAQLLQGMLPSWSGGERHKVEALARTAYVLSMTNGQSSPSSVPEAMVGENSRKAPVISLLRADQLFRSREADEASRILRTLVDQMGPFDPLDLYQAMSWWETRRMDWAMAFNVGAHRLGATK